MTVYSVLVFVHVLAAISLVGSSLFGPLLGLAIRRTGTVSSLREWAGYLKRIGDVVGPAAALTLATGLYLGFSGEWWGQGWLEVSLVLFVLAGVGAIGVLDPMAKRLVAAADEAPDGPVPAELDRQRHDPRAAAVESMMLATDVAIVFLMTNKPGFTGSLLAVAVLWAAGGAWAVREVRHSRPASVPAAG
jgi:uncharacterized membrane protein